MLVEFIAKIVADIDVYPDDVCNEDTIGDYIATLNADIGNACLDSVKVKGLESLEILSSQPTNEGLEEYNEIVNNWLPEYKKELEEFHKRMDEYERS